MKPKILNVTAVTDNFPDGQKITAAKVQFDCDVSSCVHPEQFRVAGKTVIHTTSAGTQGIANALNASEIITGSLVNAKAIV